MSAKYKSPSFLLPNELNTSANPLNTDGDSSTGTGVNSLYSMYFNGNDEYINVSNFPFGLMDTGISSTVSIWANFNTLSQGGNVVLFEQRSGGARYVIWFNNSTNTINFYANASKQSQAVNANQWYHIVATLDGTNARFYVDGSEVGTALTYTPTNTNQELQIGKSPAIASQYFNGKIDEVAIFNRALDSTEIPALYGGTSPNIYPSNLIASNLNPIAYYPLGEQAQNTGYLTQEVTNGWQFPNGVLQDYVMDFDGSNEIQIPSFSLSSEFSIGVWLNADTFVAGSSLIFGYNANNSNKIEFNGNSNILIKNPTTNTTYAGTAWNLNEWQHLLITRNTSNNLKIYRNGQYWGGGSHSGTFIFDRISGFNSSSRHFDGRLSNVAIWNSDQESNRDDIYNNGSPQTSYTVSPQNWWKLNATSVYTPSAPNYTKALKLVNVTSTSIDSIDFTQGLLNNLSEFSISFWYNRLTNLGNTGTILKQTGVFSVSQYRRVAIFSGIEVSLTTSNGTFNITASTQGVVPLNEWLHVSIVYDGSNINLYRNGTIADGTSVVAATGNTVTNTNNFKLEPLAQNEQFLASNLAFYNSALTASQISTLFNFGTPETNISFSPQAWWKLDDQNAITDYSNNGNTGTNNGATDISSGVAVTPSWKIPSALPITTTPNFTTALDFVPNDYINCGNDSSLNIYNNITISAWIKADSFGGYNLIIGRSTNKDYDFGVYSTASGGAMRLHSGNGTQENVVSTGTFLNTGEWYHLAVTRTVSPNEATFFINGQQLNTASLTRTPIGSTDITRIGSRSGSFSFDGEISNVSIFNTDLTPSQISTLYNNGTPETAISFSPIGWWKLDTGGSTITDYGSGGNNGTNNGPAAQLPSDVLATQPVNGVSTTLPSTALQQSDLQFDSPYSNYSLSFDGTGDYIDCTDISYFSGADRFTLSTWFKVTDNPSTNTNRDIISKGSTTSGTTSFFIRKGKNTNLNKISVSFDEGSTNVFSTTQIQNDVWYHVVAVYKGYESNNTDRAKIYINGVDDTASYTNTVPTTLVSSTQPLRIGRWASGTDFFGKIDETAIWQSVLTDAQILQVYNNGRPSDITSLSPNYWWRLGENAYFNDVPAFTVPNSISGAPNGTGSGTINTMISADAPETYANGIGTNLDIIDRVGDAALSIANSQSYNMIPSDISPYVPQYVGDQIANNFSMTFDGVNDYIKADTISSLNSATQATISFWAKRVSGQPFYVGDWVDASNSFHLEYYSPNNSIYFVPRNGSGSFNINYAQSFDTNWHHYVGVYDGSNVSNCKLYVDGVDVGTNSGSLNSSLSSVIGNNFTIGAMGSPTYYGESSIDEVAIWNTALNAGQIYNDIYQPTATGTNQTADLVNNPNLPNPVAWYRMGD